MICTTRIRARYQESDQMGFIHHSCHIVWMEQARMDLFRECGIDYRLFETEGYLIPVTRVTAEYVSPAFFDDEILVHAAFTHLTGVQFRIDYQIYRNETRLLGYGYSEHCVLKKSDRKPTRIPLSVRNKIKLSDTAKSWKTANMI